MRNVTPPYIELSGLGKEFGKGARRSVAIRDVNLAVARGEFVSLIGHSGCGKSTVLGLVAGLDRPTHGQVLVGGRKVERPGADRAVVFQNYSLLPWLTVYQNVYQAAESVLLGTMQKFQIRETTERHLRMVGLWEHRRKRPPELSGGMRQRVSIARAFAVEPEVLLLDEPFGALDALTKSALHDELLRMWSDGSRGLPLTILMVTHDIDEALYLSDRVVVMTDGPAATIREVITVPLGRPRDKRAFLHDPVCLDLKARLVGLLEMGHALAARRVGIPAA